MPLYNKAEMDSFFPDTLLFCTLTLYTFLTKCRKGAQKLKDTKKKL